MGSIFIVVIFNELLSVLKDIAAKTCRNKNVNAKSILACYAFTIPAWLCILFFHLDAAREAFSPVYFIVTGLWVVLVFAFIVMLITLLRYQSLSEWQVLQFCFAIFLALLADTLIFRETFAPLTLLGCMFIFSGGFLLNMQRARLVEKMKRQPFIKILSAVLFMAFSSVCFIALYKFGLNHMSAAPLFHVALSQILVFTLFFVCGFKSLACAFKDRRITIKEIVFFSASIFAINLMEFVIVYTLPLVVFFSIGMLKILVFATLDIRNKELKFSTQTGMILMLIFSGIVFTAV